MELSSEMRASMEGERRERQRIIAIIERGNTKFVERAKLIRQIARE